MLSFALNQIYLKLGDFYLSVDGHLFFKVKECVQINRDSDKWGSVLLYGKEHYNSNDNETIFSNIKHINEYSNRAK